MKKTVALFICCALIFLIAGCAADSEPPGATAAPTEEEPPNQTAEPEQTGSGSDEELWQTVTDAYVFAFPLVLMDATARSTTNTVDVTEKKAPVNQFIHSKQLADASVKQVVTPNVDTLYSQVFFDLSEDALVFRKPAADRFLSVEIMDAYSNSTAILGTGGDTQDERIYLLTGPDFSGEVPGEMTHVSIPTNSGWIIIRTIVENDDDLENVYALQNEMAIVPLSAYLENGFDYTAPQGEYSEEEDFVPIDHVLGLAPGEYFSRANGLMESNLPAEDDAPVMERLADINVGAGLSFDSNILGENAEQEWAELLSNLEGYLAGESSEFLTTMGAWTFTGFPIAEFGTEYEYRALIALAGFGANPVSVAIYPKAETDDDGSTLNGKDSYTLHFEKDELPPTEEYGFWSITAYGDDDFLIDNEIDRYVINDRSEMKYNDDGSLDILVQAKAPADVDMMGNWLPSGESGFHIHLRIYLPSEDALGGSWQAPAITKQ